MKWDWHDIVAVILAVGATVAVILIAVEELRHYGHVSPDEAVLLSTAIGAIVGALAVYLGRRNGQ